MQAPSGKQSDATLWSSLVRRTRLLPTNQVLPKQLHDNVQSSTRQPQAAARHWDRREWAFPTSAGSRVGPGGLARDQDTGSDLGEHRRGGRRHFGKMTLPCGDAAHQEIVPEENLRECWDLTPEGGRAERIAVGAPVLPEKSA